MARENTFRKAGRTRTFNPTMIFTPAYRKNQSLMHAAFPSAPKQIIFLRLGCSHRGYTSVQTVYRATVCDRACFNKQYVLPMYRLQLRNDESRNRSFSTCSFLSFPNRRRLINCDSGRKQRGPKIKFDEIRNRSCSV